MNHNIEYLTWTFTPDKISSGNLYLAASLLASSLEVNSLTAEVECDDPSILDFERNTPLRYYTRPDQPMIFRVQTIKRVGPKLYELTATSTLGLLSEGLHYGGIYTGQTAKEVIASICGTVPFAVKHNLEEIKLYGWLPIASPRDNLAQVLFAIGAALKTDLEGVLRIEGLWDGIAGAVTRDDMYTEAAVDYDGKVTQVIVSEHQYVPWTEVKQLFEGTAQEGDVITFDEPMHTLTADGFTILASGANWAKVSAGSGVLSGKTYLHNTRQITKDVWPAQEPNVKTVKDATLVSLVNSQACAQRLADYYKCRERVNAPVVYNGELPGDRLATYHPFDKTGVAACLESADINLSNTLKAQERSLVGFVPPNIGESGYYDTMEIIESDTTWEPPDGVVSAMAVLIGGGDGGTPGESGTSGSRGSRGKDYSSNGAGGLGGQPGTPGNGGKIYQTTITIEHGQTFSALIGKGGKSGLNGGDTLFGLFSSADGASSAGGFLEPISGQVFAVPGVTGVKGGDGSKNSAGERVSFKGKTYNGGSRGGYSYIDPSDYPDKESWGIGGGGGAAVGSNGSNGETGHINFQPFADGGSGGAGGNAQDGENGSVPGQGGGGGHGGGGGGGGGAAWCIKGSTVEWQGSGGRGGSGGNGGDGADGCIILYYSAPKKVESGQLVDKNNKMILDRLGRRIIV